MTSPVLVTGGTGRLGRFVVARLVDAGREVRVPVPGSKAVRNGALLPPPGHTEGVRTWDQFLAEELPEHRGSLDPASRVNSA
jgi:uncharacterized protein YbjT (DUF2867 family)